jgi:hypothetical protein
VLTAATGNVTRFKSGEPVVRIHASLYRSGCHRSTGNASRFQIRETKLSEQRTAPVPNMDGSSTSSLGHVEVNADKADAILAIFPTFPMPLEPRSQDNDEIENRSFVTAPASLNSPLLSISD